MPHTYQITLYFLDLINNSLDLFESLPRRETQTILQSHVHICKRKYSQFGFKIQRQIVKIKTIANPCSKSHMVRITHRIIAFHVVVSKISVRFGQTKSQIVKPRTMYRLVQNRPQHFDLLTQLTRIIKALIRRVNTHLGIITKRLDQQLKPTIIRTYVLVIPSVVAKQDKKNSRYLIFCYLCNDIVKRIIRINIYV